MRLDLATRTLFADFQEIVFSRSSLERKINETQTYVRKTVKGKVYWYKQYYENNQAKQIYFGPAGKENDQLVDEAKRAYQSDKAMLKKLSDLEERQAAMLRRSGLPVLDRRMSTILRHLSNEHLIDQYGVLVGTLAFIAYAGIFGCLFDKSSLMTQDIDIARDDLVEIAAPIIDINDLFSRRGVQCRAVPSLSKTTLPSSFVTEDGLRIDLLVPLRGKERKNVRMPRLHGAGATALRFLDFLIKEPVRTVLLTSQGGVSVTVPAPERFAVHKLIVAAYRPVAESGKREKDLHQAKTLISILSEERPKELKRIRNEAFRAGKKWEQAIIKSAGSLPDEIQKIFK